MSLSRNIRISTTLATEKILQPIGVDSPRAALANWMIKSSKLIQAVINLLRDQLLGCDIIHMDETTVQVLNE
ncbi:hypothetical protein MNBD_GAMMA12-2837 [hydrothermal vent metagenome]|uniref:Transposase IS66 central domain-containing protein n=1 Tax=hydrothermal vent metagenome TaxID=652676 RepID=A0A3B0YYB2_9ZZZZ